MITSTDNVDRESERASGTTSNRESTDACSPRSRKTATSARASADLRSALLGISCVPSGGARALSMTREKKRERKREREEQKPLPSLDLDALRPQSLCSFPTFHLPSFRPTRAFSSRSEGYRVILLNSNPVSSEDEEKEKPFFRERERESERERREREREREKRAQSPTFPCEKLIEIFKQKTRNRISGNHHDRPGHRRPHLHRAHDPGARRGDHRQREARRGAPDHGR